MLPSHACCAGSFWNHSMSLPTSDSGIVRLCYFPPLLLASFSIFTKLSQRMNIKIIGISICWSFICLKYLFFYYRYLCLCVLSHMWGNQHRSEDSVNHPRTNITATWMLGIELWRAARMFNFETSLQPLYLCTFLTIVQTFMSRNNRSTV